MVALARKSAIYSYGAMMTDDVTLVIVAPKSLWKSPTKVQAMQGV